MESWKTSAIGIVLILIGVMGMGFAGLDKITGGAIITAGIGLIAAKDNK